MPNGLIDAGGAVVDAGISQLERDSAPNVVAARALLKLARQLELDADRPGRQVPWLVTYIDCCAGD